MRIPFALLIFAAALFPPNLRATDDPLAEPNAAAVISALEAVDGLSALSELDFVYLERERGRTRLTQQSLDGGTLLDGRQRQRMTTERTVLAMGEVKGKYARLAQLVGELWGLADAEASLVTGVEPVDDGFIVYAKQLVARTAAVRAKMRPLLPPGTDLAEPLPVD